MDGSQQKERGCFDTNKMHEVMKISGAVIKKMTVLAVTDVIEKIGLQLKLVIHIECFITLVPDHLLSVPIECGIKTIGIK